MEAFLAYNTLYFCLVLPISALVFLVARCRYAVKKWYLPDVIMLIFPVILYWLLDGLRVHRYLGHSKTLANLAELVWLAVFVCCLFVLRVLMAGRGEKIAKYSSYIFVVCACLATLAVYCFTPALAE